MPSLYDIYPYSEEPLPEFQLMQQFPNQTDMRRFADAAFSLLGTDPSTARYRQADEEVRCYRDYVFNEGMLGISEVALLDGQDDEPQPVGFEVEVSLTSRPGDMSKLRNILIRAPYSEPQLAAARLIRTFGNYSPIHRGADFDMPPRLVDLGVSDLNDPQMAEAFSHMPPIDLDKPPSGLDIQKGTLSEDVEFAEFKDHAERFVDDLIASGIMEPLLAGAYESVDPQMTVVSQKTLRRLTRFMMSLE